MCFFFFSILFLTCCDIQCDSTVRARGLRLLLHNKMLQLTCPTLFPPQIDKHTHNLRSGRELSQFSCRAENCYPQMLNESWAGFRGGNSPKFFWGFFFFLFFIFYWPAMWHTTLLDVYWKEKQISWFIISINSFVFLFFFFNLKGNLVTVNWKIDRTTSKRNGGVYLMGCRIIWKTIHSSYIL